MQQIMKIIGAEKVQQVNTDSKWSIISYLFK